MLERLNVGRPARVIGADGRPLTLADLPARDVRWSKKRKAQVVAAVRGNLISFDEAMRRYGLSPVEFIAWESEVLVFLAARQRATERRDFRVLSREARAAAWKRGEAV
jgi:hypothetical protein